MCTARLPVVDRTDAPRRFKWTHSSVSLKDEIWILRMCHHISNAVYLVILIFLNRQVGGWQKRTLPVIMKRCVCKLEICLHPSFTCLRYPVPPPHSAAAPRGPEPPHRGFTIIDAPHSVDILWTRYQPHAEISTLTRDSYFPCGIRTPNSSRRAAVNPRLTPRGQRDRPVYRIISENLWPALGRNIDHV
jgi:hypothetical protein